MVRHSDPAEAGTPDTESAAKIAFQGEPNITRDFPLPLSIVAVRVYTLDVKFPFEVFRWLVRLKGTSRAQRSLDSRLRYMDAALRPLAAKSRVGL